MSGITITLKQNGALENEPRISAAVARLANALGREYTAVALSAVSVVMFEILEKHPELIDPTIAGMVLFREHIEERNQVKH